MTAIQVDGGLPIVSHVANSIGSLYPAERVDVVLRWSESNFDTDTEITIALDKEWVFFFFYPFLYLLEYINRYLIFPNFALTPTQSFLLSSESTNRRSVTNAVEVKQFNLREAAGLPLVNPLPDAESVFMIYSRVQIVNQLGDEARSFINQTIWAAQSLPLVALDRDAWDSHQLVP